jgi:predicted N-formylglutamate amidohydrolase
MLVSIHSFTPALLTAGSARPWHVGVMASRDTRLSDALLQALGERPGLHVAFNQPYSGITHGYCLKVHGLAQGIPHAQIEIRQDLICTPAGEAWWADLLSQVLVPIVASERFHRLAHF